MTMHIPFSEQWHTWRSNWLNRRVPPATALTLSRRNLFIFPTRTGGWYLVLTLAIFLLGSNYENNLVLALSYLLFSLFVVSMHYCHFNVSRLRVTAESGQHCYAGQSLRFALTLHNDQAPRYRITSYNVCYTKLLRLYKNKLIFIDESGIRLV